METWCVVNFGNIAWYPLYPIYYVNTFKVFRIPHDTWMHLPSPQKGDQASMTITMHEDDTRKRGNNASRVEELF